MSRRPADEWVVLTHVPNQPIADLVANILASEGIDSYMRRTLAFDVPDFLAAGARVVLVPRAQHAAAQALLAELDAADDRGPNVR